MLATLFFLIHIACMANAKATASKLTQDEETYEDPDHGLVPSFEWDVEYHNKHNGRRERLKIHFPDAGPDDYALLNHTNPLKGVLEKDHPDYNPEEIGRCIFAGYLQNENDVAVNVNGCPMENNFEVK